VERRGRILRRMAAGFAVGAIALAAAAIGLDRLDRLYPPPLAPVASAGTEVVDRDGRLLRAFADAEGRWRLGVRAAEVDPQFLAMLIAYEDRRFAVHKGVDPVALARAALQLVTHGRIVSGGSTLTMQLARLLEPREGRSLTAKLRQILRAIQIERRLDKEEILSAYLTLAPYGGNLEGVRAASLAWFGKEPGKLAVSEAALLVALPQLPERRRPDRFPELAREARDRVLKRMAEAGVIAPGEVARAAEMAVPRRRLPLPALAPHLADTARKLAPGAMLHRTTLDRDVQAAMEGLASDAARRLGRDVSIAIVVADATSGEILAEVGSADYFDERRLGWIGMTDVPRSPGSALKPFIYGLAFQQGIAAPETLISDRPANFAGYRPRNFDLSYQGDVSVRTALQLSLNVPALRLLEALGPARLSGLLRDGGIEPVLPRGEAPGLAIGLGGAGVTLKALVQAYTAFVNGGRVATIGNGVDSAPSMRPGRRILDGAAAWHVADILSGTPRPPAAGSRQVAFKTGTSYGYRDAWSVGFDGRHVIGIWAGTPDNRSVPGLSGIAAAAPVLFEAFARSGLLETRLPPAPAGAVRLSAGELPAGLRRFASAGNGLVPVDSGEPPPEIVYPPQGARVELDIEDAARARPLVIKVQGGRAPFRLIANDRPLDITLRRRTASWMPDGRGFSTLTIVDSLGKAASVTVYVD
jgi:penicillin-binding protein 1C